MLGDERLELRYELTVASLRQVRCDSPLQGEQAELREAPDRRLGESVVGEVRERSATPERESVAERPGGRRRILALGPLEELLEGVEVELTWRRTEHVARRARLEYAGSRAERLPQT